METTRIDWDGFDSSVVGGEDCDDLVPTSLPPRRPGTTVSTRIATDAVTTMRTETALMRGRGIDW